MKPLMLGSNYSLRVANENDFNSLTYLLKQAYEESPYDGRLNNDFAIEILASFLDELNKKEKVLIVLLFEDSPVGLIMGQVNDLSEKLTGKKTVSELMWYTSQDHRTRYSLKLLEALEFWAKEIVGAKSISFSTYQSTTSDRIGKIYERKGYVPIEKTYIKDL